jgi:hypothetical protein
MVVNYKLERICKEVVVADPTIHSEVRDKTTQMSVGIIDL